MANKVPPKKNGNKATVPEVESPDAQRATRDAENRAVHAAMRRDPWGALLNLAHVIAGSNKLGSVDVGRILTAVERAVWWGDAKALRGKGGPLGWAQRYLQNMPKRYPYPSSQIAFVRELEDFVRERMHLDSDELASWVLGRLLPWAETAGLGWHTHTPRDVDGLRGRIANEIQRAWERTPVTVDRTVQAILVGWGLTRAEAEKACKKA